MNTQNVGTALITGASSGIGAAFSRQLASRGFGLILVARREKRLSALAAELEKSNAIDAEILAADLSKPAGIERTERRIAELPNLTLLINNAGFGTTGKFADANLDKQLNMIQVHVIASVRLCRASLPGMIARGKGSIINVCSLAAFIPLPGNVTYSATKAYLYVFSNALQTEFIGTGVKVQALVPGFIHTEFHDSSEFASFDRSRIPRSFWMTAEKAASKSLSALERNKPVCIPGFKNRLIVAMGRSGLANLLLKILTRYAST